MQSIFITNNCAFVELFFWTSCLESCLRNRLSFAPMESGLIISRTVSNDLLTQRRPFGGGIQPRFRSSDRIADERFGDFQANGILPFAKRKSSATQSKTACGKAARGSCPPAKTGKSSGRSGHPVNFSLSADFSPMAEDKTILEQGRILRLGRSQEAGKSPWIFPLRTPQSKCMSGTSDPRLSGKACPAD